MADRQPGAGVADQEACTGVRPPQKAGSQRPLQEEPGRLPAHPKNATSFITFYNNMQCFFFLPASQKTSRKEGKVMENL